MNVTIMLTVNDATPDNEFMSNLRLLINDELQVASHIVWRYLHRTYIIPTYRYSIVLKR